MIIVLISVVFQFFNLLKITNLSLMFSLVCCVCKHQNLIMCKMGMSKDSFHDNGKFQLPECPNGLCSSFRKQIDLIQM